MAKDFFISYHISDRPWAEWIAWVLKENGYNVASLDRKIEPGNRANLLPEEVQTSRQIIATLSEAYFKTNQALAKIAEKYGLDPETGAPKLLPIRVEPCNPQGLLNSIQYLDFVYKSETEAEQLILQAVEGASPLQVAVSLSVPVPILSASISESQTDKHYFGQLQLRRRSQSVEYFAEQLTDNISIEMMQIPAGSFLVGSPDNELERQDREGPQQDVSLASFFMGKYPITQFQWRFVAGLPPMNLRLNPNPARFKGDTHPVEQISWLEAVEFCDRLSLHTGRPYRLPTEAEWEYACRANTTTPFHFGETITTHLANYNGADEQHGAYGRGPKGENRQTTTSVYHFGIANAFGLCDLHGNIWEWCQDQWRSTYGDDSLKRKIKAASQPEQSTHRLARGGSWYTTPQRCRSASRIHFEPNSRHPDLGFRVVCSPTP